VSDDGSASPLQRNRVQVVVLLVLIPVALWAGWRSYATYSKVVECERLFLKASDEMTAKQWRPALEDLDRCLKVNSIYFPAYQAQALIYSDELKDDQAVRAVLERAVAECKDDARAHQLYGVYLLHHFKDYKRAQEYLAKAAQAMPDDIPLRNMLRAAQDKLAASGQGQPVASPQAAPSGVPASPQAVPSGAPASPQAVPSGAPASPQAVRGGAPATPQAVPSASVAPAATGAVAPASPVAPR